MGPKPDYFMATKVCFVYFSVQYDPFRPNRNSIYRSTISNHEGSSHRTLYLSVVLTTTGGTNVADVIEAVDKRLP